tara:strand:- start:358 stop:546 length:189 start_codon:yes stop_codon:yes gene_type:complete
MSEKESETHKLSDHEIKMWNEIYLKYLYQNIKNDEVLCNLNAKEDADSAMKFILAKNKSRTL